VLPTAELLARGTACFAAATIVAATAAATIVAAAVAHYTVCVSVTDGVEKSVLAVGAIFAGIVCTQRTPAFGRVSTCVAALDVDFVVEVWVFALVYRVHRVENRAHNFLYTLISSTVFTGDTQHH